MLVQEMLECSVISEAWQVISQVTFPNCFKLIATL